MARYFKPVPSKDMSSIARSLSACAHRFHPCLQKHQLRGFSAAIEDHNSRPTTAPKSSIDTKHIRQNPDLYSQNCVDRNYKSQAQHPFRIVELFERWRTLQQDARSLRERSNHLRTQLSHSKTFSGLEASQAGAVDKEQVLREARTLKDRLQEVEAEEGVLNREIERLASGLPNLTSDDTPVGSEPKVVEHINQHPEAGSAAQKNWQSHVFIGKETGTLDFGAAAATSGWGWYYLLGEGALLEQALVQYAYSVALQHGFSVVSPPSMVYAHIASACGFRPRDQGGEQQIYAIEQSAADKERGKPELCLAATAEIPFAAMKANTDMDEADLPLRIVGCSRCYRAEAGARGADTKGLYRVHEFTKVEMFGWTKPDGSGMELFQKMVSMQKQMLQALGLHCRVLEQPSTDLGASATRKQDIEVFFPSRRDRGDGWGEATSTSLCTDYQTRRLATRIRNAAGGKLSFPYTVNGTAIAVPRVLAAILENHWDEQASCVRIPEVLWPWMHGVQMIRKKR